MVAADWAPAGLKQYVEGGGNVLLASAQQPEFEVAPVVRTVSDREGLHPGSRSRAFPSLKDTDLLMLNGPFTEVKADGPRSLTLIPPSMIGPPEFVHVDMKDTDTPAIVTRQMGKGTVTWVPWNLGGMYYRHSLPAHAGLFRDLVAGLQPRPSAADQCAPSGGDDAHAPGRRTLLHLINLSGHSQTGYFPPVPMRGHPCGDRRRVRDRQRGPHTGSLAVKTVRGYAGFTLPQLLDYELVVLE